MMLDLYQTHNTVEKLLSLLQCDQCGAALHQPFTTGVCEHILCPMCSPSRKNGSTSVCSACPVCLVPVHPRDCKVHPRIAHLVLVARRLKKITTSTMPKDDLSLVNEKPVTSVATDHPDGFIDSYDSSLTKTEEPCSSPYPKVTLKRAYSSSSSTRTAIGNPNQRPKVTLKRACSNHPVSPSIDGISISSAAPIRTSFASGSSSMRSEVTITRKPRLNRPRNAQLVTLRPSSVTCQSLSRRTSQPSECSQATVSTVNHRTETINANGLTSEDSTFAKPTLERNVASKVHTTRRLSKQKSLTTTPDAPLSAPVASPEDSCLTDRSALCLPETKVALNRIEKPAIQTSKPTEKESKISSRLRIAKSRKSMNTDKDLKLTSTDGTITTNSKSTRSSSRLSRFMQKLQRNSKGESNLHRAAIRGDVKQVKELISSGLSPNLRDHAGWTPLHEAVLRGFHEVAEVLLNAGATVDVPGGPELDTALHEAIQNVQLQCCQLLLSHGANPQLQNGSGLTPIQLVDTTLSKFNNPSPNKKRSKKLTSDQSNTNYVSLVAIRELLNKKISASEPTQSTRSKNRIYDSVCCSSDSTTISSSTLNRAPAITFIERRRLRPVLLATGLTRSQQSIFTRVAGMIHARVSQTMSPEVTHVVTGAPQELPGLDRRLIKRTSKVYKKPDDEVKSEVSIGNATCPRTLKFLNAVLNGCWILSFDWIETCAHVKMRVEEEGFEVIGCSTAPDSGAPRRARLAKEAGSVGLFHGLRMCLLGEFAYPMPSVDELATLARAGGATVVFCRERCSPLRLARLSIEATDTSDIPTWELLNKEVEDEESDSEKTVCSVTEVRNNLSCPLLVLYDPRTHSESNGKPNEIPYPVDVVNSSLTLIRPVPPQTPPMVPLRAVPATWLLDSAAEYTVLDFPSP